MSKSSKPVLFYLLVLLITVAGFILTTVIVRISYEQLLMKKDKSEKERTIMIQEQKKLSVIHQDLTSEDNIVPYAERNLMLVKNFKSVGKVKISEERVQFIEEALTKKYE